DPPAEITLREAEAVLDEELARLPDRLRAPLVLCYLEGVPRAEAARRLGWSLATLKRRLGQGRERLRLPLTPPGLPPPPPLAEGTAPARLPAALAGPTARAAQLLAAGQAVTGVISAEAAALLDGATRSLGTTALKLGVPLVLLGVLALGAALAAFPAREAGQ